MSKNIWIVLVLLAIVIGGSYYYQSSKSTKIMDNATTESFDTMMEKDAPDTDTMMQEESRYLPYTPALLSSTSTPRRVLFFYASWCPTCIPANADFEQNASLIPEDLTVIRVNYNDPDTDADEKALAAKYGISYQHTFVQIDQADKVITTWNGGKTADLLKNIK